MANGGGQMENAPGAPGCEPALEAEWPLQKRHYILFILCLVGIVNFIDRQILSILLEPIRTDLGVSDSMMGLLSGIAFAAFYAVAGLPLARLADRANRKKIIVICLTIWSGATALCGLAQNYWQLALARIGVAGGEAGAGPATQSLLADLYPVTSRGFVLGILNGAQAVGIAFGMFLGGWLNTTFDWRTAFFVVGAPGILLALVMAFTVKEPPRGLSDSETMRKASGDFPPLGQVARFIFGSGPLRLLILLAVCSALAGYSILAWGPAYLIRSFGWSTMDVGLWMGLSTAFGLVVGNLGSGLIADRFARGDLSRYMLVAGVGTMLAWPFMLLFALAPTPGLALLGLFAGKMLMTFWLPPTFAVALSLAPPRMRAMVAALLGLCMTLIGSGMGPLFTGLLSDALAPAYGAESLRYALAIMSCFILACCAVCFVAMRACRRDTVQVG